MPPRRYSRHTFSIARKDSEEKLVLSDPEPYRYRPFPDNRVHVVKGEDTLFTLAAKYFKGFDRPNGLWWIIADFQPDPIHDPTLRLTEGTTIVIPSMRTVIEEIFSEKRYDEQ